MGYKPDGWAELEIDAESGATENFSTDTTNNDNNP